MKKLLLAFVIVTMIITACGKKEDKKVEIENSNKIEQKDSEVKEEGKLEQKKVEEDKKQDVKQEVKNVEQKNETKSISGIYGSESSVIFDKGIEQDKVKEFAKENNIQLKENEPIKVSVDANNKIVSLKEEKNISVIGKYVGLSDNTTAEFSYDNHSFVVKINEKQLEQLEKLNQDVLLSLEITKNGDGENLSLISFSQK